MPSIYLSISKVTQSLMASYGSSSRLEPSAPFLPETPCHGDDLYGNFPAASQVEAPYRDGNIPVGYYRVHRVSSHNSHIGVYSFPVGTDPTVIRAFQMVDRDRSGFIDEKELQLALSSGYHSFNLRTIKLIMFLYRNPNDPARFGPREFAALWSCLRQWMAIFKRFDRDRSGKIDLFELRDALYSLGYALPPSVLQVLISRYNDGTGRRTELNFDSFVECGMIVKGLTEEFKEKDVRFSGSATISYDTFMSMIIPFLVSYN